jgi:MFS family permease
MRSNKKLSVLSFAFMLIFLGYVGAQQYLTVYFTQRGHPHAGFISLLLVYGPLLFMTPLAPKVVTRYGLKNTLLGSAFIYVLFLLSLQSPNIYPVYLAACLVGISAAILWNAHGVYLIKISTITSYGKNAGTFHMIHSLGAAAGLLIMAYMLPIISYSSSFFVLLLFALTGFGLLTLLPRVPGAKVRTVSIRPYLKNRMTFFLALAWLPLTFSIGLSFGLIPLQIDGYLGLSYVGALSALFYIFPVLFSYAFEDSPIELDGSHFTLLSMV